VPLRQAVPLRADIQCDRAAHNPGHGADRVHADGRSSAPELIAKHQVKGAAILPHADDFTRDSARPHLPIQCIAQQDPAESGKDQRHDEHHDLIEGGHAADEQGEHLVRRQRHSIDRRRRHVGEPGKLNGHRHVGTARISDDGKMQVRPR
jgi:hypothetical protein